METIILDTLGGLRRHGHGLFGSCRECGSLSRYWADVTARRAPRPSMFDIDIDTLVSERGHGSAVVGLAPVQCPHCGSADTETRITTPAKPVRAR